MATSNSDPGDQLYRQSPKHLALSPNGDSDPRYGLLARALGARSTQTLPRTPFWNRYSPVEALIPRETE